MALYGMRRAGGRSHMKRLAILAAAILTGASVFRSAHLRPSQVIIQPTTGPESACATRDKQATGWSDLTDGECLQRFTAIREAATAAVRNGSGTLLFKHVHKAGGTTLCQLAQRNMIAEDVLLPFRSNWSTNCVPYEAFLGPHPAVRGLIQQGISAARTSIQYRWMARSIQRGRRRLHNAWLGAACFLGFLTPAQLRVVPAHYRPLTFIASEGPLPDEIPLDVPLAMMTMLRNPLDRVLSSYRWWQYMMHAMPEAPTECHAYWAPPNSTLQEWLIHYPDNWVTRELAGASTMYGRSSDGLNFDPLTEDDVLRAKQRLQYFAAILIMERPEASQMLMQTQFGWRDVDFMQHRAGSMRNSSAEEELRGQPQLLELMWNLNQHDIDLYEFAVRLHEAQVANALTTKSEA